jgi:flagellar biosynthetic protein FlhB
MEESRTEQPSARKLERARRRGVVPHSPGLTAAAAVLGLLGALSWLGPRVLRAAQALLLAGLRGTGSHAPRITTAVLLGPASDLSWLLAMLLFAISLCALLVALVQVGPMLAPGAIAADGGRLDPLARLRNAFSAEGLVELGVRLLQLFALLGIGAYLLATGMRAWFSLSLGTVSAALGRISAAAFALILGLACAGALGGACDLVYRRAQHVRRLRMSRRELELELREAHGPRELRERRARLQREALAQGALAEVERSSVLLLDTAGRALALAFDPEDAAQRAPRVVLKVQGALCARIRAAAESAGVPVRFEPSLVAELHRLELTEQVPPASYTAVAELFRELSAHEP